MKKPIITFTITAMAAAIALNGFAGDQAGQFEAKASLKQATGVATDVQGNVYVADGPAYTVRKYSPEGKYLCDVKDPVNVTPYSPIAIAVDQRNGIVYIGNSGYPNNPYDKLIKATPAGDGKYQLVYIGPPGDWEVAALAVDKEGNVYMVDRKSGRILKIDPQGKATPVVVGQPGTAGVAVDGNFNLYFTNDDPNGKTLWKATAASGYIVEEIPNTGLENPKGIAVDASDNIYVADAGANLVRKYSPAGKRQVLAAGLGIAGSKVDGNLSGVAINGSKLYFTAGNRVFADTTSPRPLFSDSKEFRNLAAGFSYTLYLVGGESLYKYYLKAGVNSEVCKMGANTYGLVVRKTGNDDDEDIFFNSAASVWHVRDSHQGKISSPNRVIDWLGPAEGALAGDNSGGFYTSAKPRGEKYWGIHTGERQEKVTSGWFTSVVFPQQPRGLAVNDKRNLYFRLADCVWTATRKQFLFFPATYSLDQQIVTGLKDSPGFAIDSSERIYLSNGEGVYYALGRDRRVGIADTVDAVKDLSIASEKGNIYIYALVRSNNVDSVWQFPIEPKTFIE